MSACTPTTEITASWSNPEIRERAYSNVLVAALTQDLRAKQTVENDLAVALRERGIPAEESSKMFAPNFTDDHMQDKEEMLERIRGEDYEAILTVSLLNKETETRYVPGSYSYVPISRYDWYGNFWGYYTTVYPSIYQPGYYTEDDTYFIETNLYDAATEDLIWSAQSKSYNPSDLNRFSEQFSELMIRKLLRDVDLRE